MKNKIKNKNLPIPNKGHGEGRIVANGNQHCEWESESSRIVANGNQNRRDRRQWESSKSSRTGNVENEIVTNVNTD